MRPPQTLGLTAVLALSLTPVGTRAQGPPACPTDAEVLVERPFAESRGIAPGTELRIRARPDSEACAVRVAGLFEPPPDPSELTVERPRVLFHLPDLASLSGREDEVDQFSVLLEPGADPDATARSLLPLLPGAQVLATAEVSERTSTTFLVVSRFHRAIGIITLVAGGVFLSCIMVLKVQERRTPIAAARLIGVPRATLLGWTVAEASLISAIGGVMGLGLGLAASSVINAYYRRAYDTTLVFSAVTAEMVIQALTLAVVLGLGAGVFAGLRLLSEDPLREAGR